MQGPDELAAFGAGPIDDLLPLVGPHLDRRKDGSGNGNRVRREGEDKLDRKLRPGHRPGGCRANLRVDDDGLAADFEKGQLCRRRRKVICPGKQLDELTPADRAVVRIGCRLRQHRVQAIVETHRDIRFLQDRSFPDLVVRAPTEGVGT